MFFSFILSSDNLAVFKFFMLRVPVFILGVRIIWRFFKFFMQTVLLFVLGILIILSIFIDFYFWVLINFDKFNIIEA